jgi:hypothetical protein
VLPSPGAGQLPYAPLQAPVLRDGRRVAAHDLGAQRRRSSSKRLTSRRASSGFMPYPPYPQVRSRAHLAITAEGVTLRKDLHASAALREALPDQFTYALELPDRGRFA